MVSCAIIHFTSARGANTARETRQDRALSGGDPVHFIFVILCVFPGYLPPYLEWLVMSFYDLKRCAFARLHS
ncbi:unnamed protein product [Prunus armeniaca]|uniref:Uncharacterized protein n=1 Tax=Prunus armeniaca TaxID=36596 RepID=A0A6J5V6G9_PRUAR|nr:unnamed protein product [Prunus armeniaca]